ncbi:hypothetical protein HPB51_019659 [Rhipicephalus microplus]|uniref:Uncharacterized protein n=1 Tax=Rhipicephalus microplus TaxID=6941 RepID=A0A9J6EC46_RHIMP|nr:hypothetical protein HPB51_019659 [Rhipicephalus microplus]
MLSLESEMASGKNNVEVLPQIEKVCVPFADAAHQATESSSATSVALSTVLTSFDECKVVGAEGSEQAYVPDTYLVPLHAIAVASLKDGEDDNEFIAMEDKEALAAMIECTSEPLKTAVTEKSLGAAELRHDDSSYCVTVSSHGPMDIAEEHSYSYRQGIIASQAYQAHQGAPRVCLPVVPVQDTAPELFQVPPLVAYGREAAQVRGVWPGLPAVLLAVAAHAHSHRRKAIPLLRVRPQFHCALHLAGSTCASTLASDHIGARYATKHL